MCDEFKTIIKDFEENWSIMDGVARVENSEATRSSYYWGEVPQDKMQRVIEFAKTTTWQEAVERELNGPYFHLRKMVSGVDRIDWTAILPIKNRRILDVGSGWGQTSTLFAEQANNTVFSLEPISERAQFQAVRRDQMRLKNLHIINSAINDIDFLSNSIDLVSLSGVLEWIGSTPSKNSPRDEQLKALKLIYRALKPAGTICIGIENRLGYNTFLGARDHSGLRFTNLLPRKLASLYMRLRPSIYRSNSIASEYRTYTYSPAGYKKLLNTAGFSNVRVFLAHKHYAHPSTLVELNNKLINAFFKKYYQPNSLKDRLKTFVFRALSFLRLAKVLPPYLIIFGEKTDAK